MHNSALGVEVFSVVEDIFVGASSTIIVAASGTVLLGVGVGEFISLSMEVWSVCDMGSIVAGEVPPGAVARRAWRGPAAASSKGHFIGSCFVRN